jgi:hypothetical protein
MEIDTMSTDLVLTLRNAAQGVSLGADGMGWSPDPAVMGNAADEIERLRAALAKANEQAERFERGWYLRGDALEGVLPYMEAAETAGLVGDEGCHWPVEAVRAALKA